jgi:cobalt/nickel transport protein
VVAAPASAHFQELIPETDILPDGTRSVRLDLAFTHPMARGPVMEMATPVRFGVAVGGRVETLMDRLKPRVADGRTAFSATYEVKAPGDYVFFVEPAPYWEAAEGKWIVHYAKVVVDAGSATGWDKPAGLPVEILPLTRPYGLWTGNLFRGQVVKTGRPVPGAEVEVEWRNDGSVRAPSDPFLTQVVKADGQGVFAYAMPRAGWWGFAALVDGAPRPGPGGKPAPVELGGVMWVKTVDMK